MKCEYADRSKHSCIYVSNIQRFVPTRHTNALIKLAKNNLLPLCYTGKKKKSNLSTEELKKLHVSFT